MAFDYAKLKAEFKAAAAARGIDPAAGSNSYQAAVIAAERAKARKAAAALQMPPLRVIDQQVFNTADAVRCAIEAETDTARSSVERDAINAIFWNGAIKPVVITPIAAVKDVQYALNQHGAVILGEVWREMRAAAVC